MKKSITWTPISEWTEKRSDAEMMEKGTMQTGILLWVPEYGIAKDGLYNHYVDRFEVNENGKQWQKAEISHFAYVNSPD